MCSPTFRGGQLPLAPGDLLKVPLLHSERQPWSVWFEADVKSGRLVRLFSQSVPTRYSYFIVYPPGSESFGEIQVFQEWLLEQVRPVERKDAIVARAGKGVAKGTLRLVRRRGLANG